MTVALTGGTGFLGQVVVRLLVPHTRQVRVLYRRPEDDRRIRSWGGIPVRGDLNVPGGCDGLVAGGDVVLHSAARVDMTGSWSQFRKTTVEGTQRLLDAALPHRPARFVYISSASVYALTGDGQAACADRTPTQPEFYNYYSRAKLEAEKLVRRDCTAAGCPWTILRLGFMYGPGNEALHRHFVSMVGKGRLAIVGSGQNRIATLYVDDAARAVLLAATHPAAANKTYDVASDEAVTQREFIEETCRALGLPTPQQSLPGERIAHIVVDVMGCLARIAGREVEVTRSMVALMAADQVIDASRVRRELGWRPEVTFAQGMQVTREWYVQSPAARSGLEPV